MSDQIGNVRLEDRDYPGEDLYSDGEIEDELLEIVRSHPQAEFDRVIREKKSWPILYHLSGLRANIIEWLPITKEQTVLEVGSGCGAITGTLADKSRAVTCIELSKKRSTINALRNQTRANIEILLGNFQDIEKRLDRKFDWITLIGVFEYGQGYIDSQTPYVDFLASIRKHLKPDGRIVIAIENRLGLKYFAGCTEDHTGKFYEGVEGYPKGAGVRTFSRPELERIIREAGMEAEEFYYPYPDYKFPTAIYSDSYLPRVGELRDNLRNFDRKRYVNFDEAAAFDSLIKDGLFPLFSNSFLVILK